MLATAPGTRFLVLPLSSRPKAAGTRLTVTSTPLSVALPQKLASPPSTIVPAHASGLLSTSLPVALLSPPLFGQTSPEAPSVVQLEGILWVAEELGVRDTSRMALLLQLKSCKMSPRLCALS